MKKVQGYWIILLFCVSLHLYAQVPVWQWARAIHTDGIELARDVAADSVTGNIYIAGVWRNDLSGYFPGNSYPSTDFSSTYGGEDGLVVKYDQNGTILWAFKIGGTGNDEASAITLDSSGNIYITGYIDDGTNYFSGTSLLTPDSTIDNSSGLDFFVAKYNPDGALLWVRHSDGSYGDAEGRGIYAENSSVFASGHCTGSTSFGPFSGSFNQGDEDYFVAKYDGNGSEQWLLEGGSDRSDFAHDVLSDGTNVYFVGSYEGDTLSVLDASGIKIDSIANASSGKTDIFILSFDVNSNYNWGRKISSDEDDDGYGITHDTDSLYITGGINNSAYFPDYINNPVTVSFNKDIFISSHSKSSGNTGWVRTVACTSLGDEEGLDIVTDSTHSIYVTGYFNQVIDFGDTTITGMGNKDIFVASFLDNGTFNWAKIAGSSGAKDIGSGISTDNSKNIYIAGYYNLQAFFDTDTLPENGGENIFLANIELDTCINAVGGTASTSQDHICLSESTTISLTGYYGIIQWQSSPYGINSWTDISGENTPTLVVSPNDTTDYRAFLTSDPCQPDSSNTITVYVYELPHASISGDKTICDDGALATLTVDLTGSPPWDVIIQRDGINDTTVTGINISPYTIEVSQAGIYTLAQVEDINCIGTTSGSATIAYFPTTTATITGDTTICEGNSANLKIELTGDSPWNLEYSDGVDTFSIPGINSSPYFITVNPLSATTYYLVSVGDVHGCSGTVSGTATVNVDEQPAANAGPGGDECDLDYTLQATPSVGTGTWTKTLGPGTASFTPDAGTPNALVTVDAYGSYDFTWTEVNGTCSDDSTITVNFYEQPAANAGSGGNICGSFDFTYNATPFVYLPLPNENSGTHSWTKISIPGSASFNPDNNTPNATVTVTRYNVFEFVWTETNGTCSDSDTVTVDFNEDPVNASAGSDITATCDSLEATLAGTAHTYLGPPNDNTGSTRTWSYVSGPDNTPTFTDATDPGADVTVDYYGVYEFEWVETNGNCTVRDTVVVDFYENPDGLSAGTDITATCDALITTLAGTEHNYLTAPHQNSGTQTWLYVSGPDNTPTFTNTTNPGTDVTVDYYGVYEFEWVETNGNCTVRDMVTVVFYEQPAADAGSGGDECDLDYALQATPSAGTGTWTKTLGPGSASFTPDAGTPNALVTVDAYGSYDFTWTEVNGTCSDDSTITVNFYEQPVANAGPGGDECDLNYALQATPSLGTGTWTKASGPGTATFTPGDNNPNTTVTVSAYGTYEFTWTEVNGACSDDSTIMVHFYEPPVANAGQDVSLCSGEESKLNASGGVTYSWSPETGLSNSNIADPIVNPTTTTLYTLTITDLNGCSGQDTVKVTVNPLPEAEAGEDITIYYGSDTVLNASGGIFYSWNPTTGLSNSSISNPIASPIATTTYFVLVTDNNGCQNTDSIKITVLPGDFANAGSDNSICPGESINLNASGGISYSWSPTNGLNDPNISNPIASPTITTTYTVSVTDTNGVQDTDDVTITVNPLPDIDVGEDINICDGESVQLQASGEGTFHWDHSNMLSNSNIPNPIASPNITTTFTVTLTDQNGCENFEKIIVFVLKQPTANAGPDQELDYVFETTMEAELNSSESGEWSVVSGSGEFSDKNSPVCMVTGFSMGDNIFTWKVTNGVCPEATDEVKITVNDFLVPSVITPNGDNKNDYFVVRGIGNFDSSELIVFNRWGAEVYKNENYKNDWDGRDHNGNKLPDDTYFFILNIKNVRIIKGYVVIKR